MLNLKKWVIISEKRIAYLGLTIDEVNIKRDGPMTVNIEPEIRYLIWEDLYNEIIFNFKFKNKQNNIYITINKKIFNLLINTYKLIEIWKISQIKP